MIRVSELTKDFGPIRAVDGISFRVGPGEIVGFLGPNGAGKTTTIRILTGFLPATRGVAQLAGFDVFRQSLEARRRVGYLPENAALYGELRVQEYLAFRGRLKGLSGRRLRERAQEVAAQCGLRDRIRQTIGTLSRGYRQRVALADALIAEPPILVLDEPTSGLDPLQRIEIKSLIRSLAPRQTILFSSHVLPEVESVCQRVILIHRGRIVADGTPSGLASGFSQRNRFCVGIASPAGTGRSTGFESELGSIAGVLRVSALANGADPEVAFFRLEASPGADPRPEVFRWAAGRGLILSELSKESLSLEEVFARLTLGGESPPSAEASA